MFSIIVNFKVYREGFGKEGKGLLREISNVRKDGYDVYFAVPHADLHLAELYGNVIAQHVDPYSEGAHTGSVIMEHLIDYGVKASLLNHSEKKIGRKAIEETIRAADSLGFRLYICSENLEETRFLCESGANYVAYEPPELIGGNVSVATSKPEIIRESTDICKSYGVKLLVGAGVRNSNDVSISSSLGAEGILVSSGIVRSKQPEHSLNSLMI
ncbi:MAG: triose-phosphate isomerase [Candidatus Thermoplasmatota archaeon]|jgi:triosephosphate isomerase|nr:triose-phosphate isomerase [Candidatus Thermoplasmatota archaeon]MCL5790609.1 triose-phosphate isomerase [Candidatus Thermoplasmatota archaeon]